MLAACDRGGKEGEGQRRETPDMDRREPASEAQALEAMGRNNRCRAIIIIRNKTVLQ